jgi:hypothetical protein
MRHLTAPREREFRAVMERDYLKAVDATLAAIRKMVSESLRARLAASITWSVCIFHRVSRASSRWRNDHEHQSRERAPSIRHFLQWQQPD